MAEAVNAATATGLGGDASPARVELELRPIFRKVHDRIPLTTEDCEILGRRFLYPNLFHWIQHLCARGTGRAYRDLCPVYEECTDCAREPMEGPQAPMRDDGADFCRLRELKHPWALQVSLIWNSSLRRNQPHGQDAERPSLGCAWDVYRRIVDNPEARRKWPGLDPRHRPGAVRESWLRLATVLEEIFAQISGEEPDSVADMVAERLDPAGLVGLCMHISGVVDMWTRRHRKIPQPVMRRLQRAFLRLGAPLYTFYRLRRPFPIEGFRKEIREFLAALEALAVPGLDTIRVLLQEGPVGAGSQHTILDFMKRTLKRLRSAGLPAGNPLNYRPVQDLFWDWVGSDDRPDSGRRFDLTRWCYARWAKAPGAAGRPQWRAVS